MSSSDPNTKIVEVTDRTPPPLNHAKTHRSEFCILKLVNDAWVYASSHQTLYNVAMKMGQIEAFYLNHNRSQDIPKMKGMRQYIPNRVTERRIEIYSLTQEQQKELDEWLSKLRPIRSYEGGKAKWRITEPQIRGRQVTKIHLIEDVTEKFGFKKRTWCAMFVDAGRDWWIASWGLQWPAGFCIQIGEDEVEYLNKMTDMELLKYLHSKAADARRYVSHCP